MRKLRSIKDEYRFPNFVPILPVKGIFGDPRAVVISLFRRGKKRAAVRGCLKSKRNVRFNLRHMFIQ